MTVHDKLGTILESNNIPDFEAVLFDFNTSKMEHQKVTFHCPHQTLLTDNTFCENCWYPSLTVGYRPRDDEEKSSVAFTRAHDMYGVWTIVGYSLYSLFFSG